MRQSLAVLAAALLSIAAIACGAGRVAGSSSPARGYSKQDGDYDFDEAGYHGSPVNDDLSLLATYGSRATPAETRTVTTLLERYYAASVAGDGARACSLLSTSLAAGLASATSQPVRGAGTTCAGPMSLLLERQHAQLAAKDVATMTVIAVYTKGDIGLAVLGFRTTPQSEMILARERGAWRINALFDGIMP
jgi:hypothetical protein